MRRRTLLAYIAILRALQGVKKTRLGLREVVSLGDFLQIIDTSKSTAVSPLERFYHAAEYVCVLTWCQDGVHLAGQPGHIQLESFW